jgi:hypothetical protein
MNNIQRMIGFILWALAFFALDCPFLAGQPLPPSVTVLYSNNINGEIDPCPV